MGGGDRRRRKQLQALINILKVQTEEDSSKPSNTPKGILLDKEETCIPKQNDCPGCGNVCKRTCN